jgi:hypothetical protein
MAMENNPPILQTARNGALKLFENAQLPKAKVVSQELPEVSLKK